MKEPPDTSKNGLISRLYGYPLLTGLGMATLALLVVAGVLRMFAPTASSPSHVAVDLAILSLYLAIGLASAGLLIGISLILRVLRDLHSALVRVERYQYEIGPAPAPPATAPQPPSPGDETIVELTSESDVAARIPPPPWQEIVRLLEDIRDNSLLTEAERQEKRQQTAEQELDQAERGVSAHLAAGDYARARQLAEAVHAKYPADPRADRIAEQLESSREQHEAEDVGSVAKQVDDLISISAWQRARHLAQQLQQRHPDSADARNLLIRIEREHGIFQEEQRRRMSAEIQRFVSRRRWEEALAAARTFVERFPGCPDSEAILLQIPTLENNADIERRQQLEAEIMDLVRHGRYIEAAELARRVIERFPDSPQAEALRLQLRRLEELANNPTAPPARVRME
ncbi:MAG TPA: tetratricopeptide repeat protein [Phycisphaerae bacterium]|nr:tetratricopeptide repeat protein [Phycisphaerae bacterium]